MYTKYFFNFLIVFLFSSTLAFSQGEIFQTGHGEFQLRSTPYADWDGGARIGVFSNYAPQYKGNINIQSGTIISDNMWCRFYNASLNKTDMGITAGGRVIIGQYSVNSWSIFESNQNRYKLYVEGGIRTEEVWVQNKLNWPDYVFNKNYNRKNLDSVYKFINAHHHLEGIPSAKEVNEKGFGLSEMDAKLLEKIEELTLYLIELNEENKQLNRRIEKLEIAK